MLKPLIPRIIAIDKPKADSPCVFEGFIKFRRIYNRAFRPCEIT